MAIITSTAGSVNTGRDIQISLVGGSGGQAVTTQGGNGLVTTIVNVTMFEYSQETIDILQTKIDSTTIIADLPRFWKGSIEFVRADNALDELIANIETNWYGGGAFRLGLMNVTVTNPTGANITMVFKDVSVKLEDGGQFSGEGLVKAKMGWRASQRTI